jgi:hypothetical protein
MSYGLDVPGWGAEVYFYTVSPCIGLGRLFRNFHPCPYCQFEEEIDQGISISGVGEKLKHFPPNMERGGVGGGKMRI